MRLVPINSSQYEISFLQQFIITVLVMLLFTIIRMLYKKFNKVKTPWPKVPNSNVFGAKIGTKNYADQFEEWARQYGEKGIYETKILGQTFYVVCNEDIASQIERKRPYVVTRRKNLVSAFNSLGAQGLFSAEGQTWKKDRRLVAPSLNHKNVRDYISKIELVAERLVTKWDGLINKNPVSGVPINDDILLATVDIIALVAFAKDLDTVTMGGGKITTVLDKLFGLGMLRTMVPIKYFKIPIIGQYLDGGKKLIDFAFNFCGDIVNDFRRENIDYDVKSKTFLGKMIELSDKDSANALSTERFIGNLLTLFGAGSETSASAAMICLYEICVDKTGLQDKLYKEIMAMDARATPSLESYLDSLPLLRSLLFEVLRMKGPTPVAGAENIAPIEVDGVMLPQNTYFLFLYKYITEVEEFDKSTGKGTPRGLRNAPINQFCPYRWLEEKKESGKVVFRKPTYATGFRAFGAGVRICPGSALAEIEVMIFVVFLLKRFEIHIAPDHPEVKLVSNLAQKPDRDIRIIMKKRSEYKSNVQ
ncbi:hypothetical protein CTEN210_12875 [Chaetoceros tenuissimus]|uniref:Cytochrome P450 n=1 Tax=Chaetoceros tenuissimus TaxID=426638 RepID=A0AAD3D5H2_9STRA|nr:hypothetical protein CTEN210_12875 [Chaetoceros tenuissimus]